MSNLLEEAIIDATALRETALKSAEAALIEKYSKEFKESVKKLLEQEEATAVPPEMPGVADPAAIPMTDPMTAGGISQTQAGGKAFDNVPSSFLDGDDDELITIDFDQLKKQLSSMPEEPSVEQPAELEASEEEQEQIPSQIDLQEDLELDEDLLEMYDAGGQDKSSPKDDALHEEGWSEEEEEEEEEELEEMATNFVDEVAADAQSLEEEDAAPTSSAVMSAQSQLAVAQAAKAKADGNMAKAQADLTKAQAEDAKKKEAGEKAAAAVTRQTELEEDFSITEEELAELAEELKVDLKPQHQLRGYMGTTNTERQLADNVEKAAARDEKEEKERKEQQEAMSDLKEKLAESDNRNEKLVGLIEELKDNLISLKEQTEKLSISNAKLLYTNKVLADVSLNERQKQQIVENISKASSVLEAKTIFGTLQSAVQSVSEKKPRESLSEALIRGSSPFLNRQKATQLEDSLSDRMKILAGIKSKT